MWAVCVYVHMCLSAGVHGDQGTVLGSSILSWVPGIELMSSGLHSSCFCLLNCLIDSTYRF